MKTRLSRSTLVLVMSAALCGGSLFSACGTRFNMATVDGSKNFVFDLLNQVGADLLADLAGTSEE